MESFVDRFLLLLHAVQTHVILAAGQPFLGLKVRVAAIEVGDPMRARVDLVLVSVGHQHARERCHFRERVHLLLEEV